MLVSVPERRVILLENPWLKLSRFHESYVLDIDRNDVNQYNRSASETTKIIEKSVPEPFIGNPESARVVLLLLNPGHSDKDWKSHANAEFKNAMFLNLRHELNEYPFYPLNPAFSWTGAGEWWQARTRNLQEAAGLSPSTIAERLLAIEWFPYHSGSSGLSTKPVCKSQLYSFELAKDMLRSKLVVRMRSKSHWAQVDRRFRDVPSLKNPRCGHISAGNTDGDLFDRIVKALR